MVKEYGVASVPFDVVVTPNGRVVSKRSSPQDASAYTDMISRLGQIINGLADGNPALNENLDQLKNQMVVQNKIVENESFEPSMPVHRAPNSSRDSAELKRKSRILNPYAAATNKTASSPAVATEIVENQFAGQPDASTRSKTAFASNRKQSLSQHLHESKTNSSPKKNRRSVPSM